MGEPTEIWTSVEELKQNKDAMNTDTLLEWNNLFPPSPGKYSIFLSVCLSFSIYLFAPPPWVECLTYPLFSNSLSEKVRVFWKEVGGKYAIWQLKSSIKVHNISQYHFLVGHCPNLYLSNLIKFFSFCCLSLVI